MSTNPVAGARHPYARAAGRFSIVVGIAIILVWAWLLINDDVPQIETSPLGMWLHIAAEIVTAIALIVAGWGLITDASWSRKLHLLASGMLLLVMIHAFAWYGERGDVGMVIAFLLLGVFTVFFALRAEE